MKNGKESTKNRYDELREIPLNEQDKFALTDQQKKYLDENGLTPRFIHQKEYLKNNNFHRSGWKVVPDPEMPGANLEGLVKIGDLVMAVKTEEHQVAHRKRLQEKADRYNPSRSEKTVANELKEAARKISSSARIYEGYEKNSPDEKDD